MDFVIIDFIPFHLFLFVWRVFIHSWWMNVGATSWMKKKNNRTLIISSTKLGLNGLQYVLEVQDSQREACNEGEDFIFPGIFCSSEKKAVKSSYVKCGTCRCLTSDLPASPSSWNVRLAYISETRRGISFGKDEIEEGLSREFRKGIHKQMRGRVTWRSFRFTFLVC